MFIEISRENSLSQILTNKISGGYKFGWNLQNAKVFYFKVTFSNNRKQWYPTLLSHDNTQRDPHVSLAQTMNGSNRGKPMNKQVSNENDGEHAEAKVEVTYL